MTIAGQARPLALWGLVSANVFTERRTPDFYLGLAPFFEPFIQDQDGKFLDVAALKNYSETRLMLPISDDVADLFIARMEEIGWLKVVANDAGSKVYRCQFSGDPADKETYKLAEGRLKTLLAGFRRYLSQESVQLKAIDDDQIEEEFLRFLSRRSMGDNRETEVAEIGAVDVAQLEYWMAKYIGWLALNDLATFEFVQNISGISLLTEALLELRNPSQSTEQAKTLVVFLDGPLLMDYVGFSGKRGKENASFIVDKLRQAGATIACFRHSCDEVRDNLTAVLGRASYERTGATAEAMRNREVSESFLSNVRNNVEFFIKKLGNVQIMPLQIDQFKHAEKFCDDALHLRLSLKMPSQSAVARERDANSIAIIMRRRAAFETTDFCASKFVLITSNDMLIRRGNEILREYRALGSDRALIGPAIHHRIVSGLLFANFGLSEKKEISRRQLLATCARVVMLRPKILERLRQQIGLLHRPEDAAMVDALLSQPRATEIVMERTVGSGRSVSASNVEGLIAAIKKTSADEIRVEYEGRLRKERVEAEHKIHSSTRELITKLQEEKERLEAERLARTTERGAVSGKISALEEQLVSLFDQKTKHEKERELEFEKMLTHGALVAERAMKRVANLEKIALLAFFVILAPIFFIPAIFSSHWLTPWLGALGAAASLIGTLYLGWNKQLTVISRYFEKRAHLAVDSELTSLRMHYLRPYMKLDCKAWRVDLLSPDSNSIVSVEPNSTSDVKGIIKAHSL